MKWKTIVKWETIVALALLSVGIVTQVQQTTEETAHEAAAVAQTSAAMIETAIQEPATGVTPTPGPEFIPAQQGGFSYDLDATQPVVVSIIESTQTREGGRVGYVIFVRDGAGFRALGPFVSDSTEGPFRAGAVDDEYFLIPSKEND